VRVCYGRIVLQPWPLPEGMEWREVDDSDRDWWFRTRRTSADECAAVTLKYRLKHHETGEEREIVERWIPFVSTTDRDEEIGHIVYALTQGSPGCGCNRRLAWARAKDEEEPDDPSCDAVHSISWPPWLAEADDAPWDFSVPAVNS
jgi:hypothetical protein